MKRHSGFTLVELLVVMTVAAVLLGLGIPSFREFVATQRVKEAAFDFSAAMLLARSEAIKRNTAVTLTQDAAGWGSGWTIAAGGTTLVTRAAPAPVTVTPSPDPATSSVTFQGTGRVASLVRFQFETANTPQVRCLTLSATGLTTTNNASCP
jgi:type IV fimbrial biogenesis protein FimT